MNIVSFFKKTTEKIFFAKENITSALSPVIFHKRGIIKRMLGAGMIGTLLISGSHVYANESSDVLGEWYVGNNTQKTTFTLPQKTDKIAIKNHHINNIASNPSVHFIAPQKPSFGKRMIETSRDLLQEPVIAGGIAVDALSTHRALHSGKGSEANPFLRPAGKNAGIASIPLSVAGLTAMKSFPPEKCAPMVQNMTAIKYGIAVHNRGVEQEKDYTKQAIVAAGLGYIFSQDPAKRFCSPHQKSAKQKISLQSTGNTDGLSLQYNVSW